MEAQSQVQAQAQTQAQTQATSQPLSPEEQAWRDCWERHLGAEFGAHSADATLETMTTQPRVNQVPIMTGGEGREQVYEFYNKYFLRQIPADIEMIPVSRTIGQGRLVDEMVVRFTHSIRMDWLLPGLLPTGKRVEVALIVIVQFEDNKVKQETLYWDHASVLAQLGLLDLKGLPVVGVEGPRSVLDHKLPLNLLIDRGRRAQAS